MAHKTFISYKYNEAQDLRDAICEALGEDATYYQGETSDSPDLTDTSTENIKRSLMDKMYNTSVTIVVVSPNMKQSKWIDWEIEYCLKEIAREGRTSKTNGVVGVIQKRGGNYAWFKNALQNPDGHTASSYNDHLVYSILTKNRFNQNPKLYVCNACKTINRLTGSYISYIEEDEFLRDPQAFIENAYDKSEDVDGYDLTKER